MSAGQTGTMRFSGKIALVTGAAAGVGRAVAERLAAEGASLMLLDCDEAGVVALAEALCARGHGAMARALDVADPVAFAEAVAACVDRFGRLDLAVNNAGINGGAMMPLWEMGDEQWHRTIAVNLDSVFYGLRAQMAAMLGHGGAIVTMGSIMGQVGMAGIAHYTASKHGLVGLTRVAAIDGGPHAIRVNAVAPTFLRTALMEDVPEAVWAHLRQGHPLPHLPSVDEVAALTCFLLSDDARAITGSVQMIDAGWTAQ